MGPANDAQRDGELVVLVHGFGGKRLWLAPLTARLRAARFRVEPWRYPSVLRSIPRHAEQLRERLAGPLSGERRLHIVAHSMGSIVVRAALAMGPIPNLGRVVFLAPPNRGSPVARVAGRFLGPMCRPISELSDRGNSYVNQLPSFDGVEFAVIAARFDILVPKGSTHLAAERRHRVLNTTHNTLLVSPTTARLVASFLRYGDFRQPCLPGADHGSA
jgi:hypothetical protein